MSNNHRALAISLTARRYLSHGFDPYDTYVAWLAAADTHDSILCLWS